MEGLKINRNRGVGGGVPRRIEIGGGSEKFEIGGWGCQNFFSRPALYRFKWNSPKVINCQMSIARSDINCVTTSIRWFDAYYSVRSGENDKSIFLNTIQDSPDF